MIVREQKLLVSQYINWKKITEYIDGLKSREYNAFFQQRCVANYKIPIVLINSPIVILLSCQSNIENLKFNLYAFELGYILFCMSNVVNLDISFFYYYRNSYHIFACKLVYDLIIKACYQLTFWYLKLYTLYLRYICSIYHLQLCKINDSFSITKENLVSKYYYVFFIDIKKYVSYFTILTFLRKVSIYRGVKTFLLKFLSEPVFINLMFYLNDKNNDLFLSKNILFRKLLELFVLQIIYEVSIILKYSTDSFNNTGEIICLYDYNILLMLCQDSSRLFSLNAKFSHLFICYNIKNKIDEQYSFQYLLKGIVTNLFILSLKYKAYPFYFVIKPSLNYQFLLMKRITSIIRISKSKPLFILNIRLNMLILLWSKIYLTQSIDKIFYLLDYLIGIKLKVDNKYYRNDLLFEVGLNKYIFCKTYIYSIGRHFLTVIYNKKYCKFYFIVKLLWLSKLKCNINLREAI